jgi:hypothetical protein
MEVSMIRILFVPAVLAVALLAQGEKAQAREYPWCARYDWTTYNCGFVTLQQCLATISGQWGRCEPNPRYVPPRGKRR